MAIILDQQKESSSDNKKRLRMAFPYSKSASHFEPTRIHLAPQYAFLENIYSPLVEMQFNTGTVVPGIAESFEWKDDEVHFIIRKDLKTFSGVPVTAEDVVFSLKRLLVLTGNTHGNFKDLVCGGVELKSIEDDCPGIKVKNGVVILKPSIKGPFLIPMLVAMDFAIIPKASVDQKTLQIINYKETSGPYFVSQDSEQGEIVLHANPNHYHYSKEMPQEIELVPSDPLNPQASLIDFENGKVDFLSTADLSKPEDVIKFSQSREDTLLHSTLLIRSYCLVFSKRGLNEFSDDERVQIGIRARKALRDGMQDVPGFKPSDQYFPALGDGGINDLQIKSLEKRFSVKNEFLKQVRIGTIRIGKPENYRQMILKELPSAVVDEIPNSPEYMTDEENTFKPHAEISGIDTAFLEDIGLISYSLTGGMFGMNQDERQKWLAEYMALEKKEDRISKLRQLHFEGLTKPTVVPILVAPYVALIRKGWKMNFSTFFPNLTLWQITKD